MLKKLVPSFMISILRKLFFLKQRTSRKIRRYIYNNKRSFKGDIFDRFRGLELLFSNCKNCSVLDFGSSYGLVGFEFVRNGAILVHGFDIDGPGIKFSQKLFNFVDVESEFTYADFALRWDKFYKKYSDILLDKYDIVLFLGVYHHLKGQMTKEAIAELVSQLLNLSEKWFAVRTNAMEEIDDLIISRGFELFHHHKDDNIGLLHIYKKKI